MLNWQLKCPEILLRFMWLRSASLTSAGNLHGCSRTAPASCPPWSLPGGSSSLPGCYLIWNCETKLEIARNETKSQNIPKHPKTSKTSQNYPMPQKLSNATWHTDVKHTRSQTALVKFWNSAKVQMVSWFTLLIFGLFLKTSPVFVAAKDYTASYTGCLSLPKS